MNNLLDPFNLVLYFIVIIFWSTTVLLAQAHRRQVSAGLLIVPAFFILVGFCINQYHLRWGTYMVALTHVVMLPALLKVAKSKP